MVRSSVEEDGCLEGPSDHVKDDGAADDSPRLLGTALRLSRCDHGGGAGGVSETSEI